MPHTSASVSERRSIRWPPAPASEPTDTLVLSGATGVFVDVRFLKDAPGEGVLDWAFAGVKEELRDGGVRFVHHIDSRTLDARSVVDAGYNTPLPDGDTLEVGEMVNPATGRVAPYEEVWRERPTGSGGVLFVANAARTTWRARVGAWEVALGRGEDGGFWAWYAEWIDGAGNGGGGLGWRVPRCAGVREGRAGVVLLPLADGRWVNGARVSWQGEEWDVLEVSE
ncbi:hypothetical protein HYPSUDRAFT_146874 [Hypholoma sublateritium FD-334 SS-4]|uniref:Protein HRI1 n=1 Tax=Hypholoma sublateritium (strain FD-334 SS-4) TaxID=945553 RepID=A0A0D2P9X6_HYPSF|nr:hypothetical protein HYPSUDRAFT_146874 [Hypholoma sublateritium FD-334 SS-4]